MFCIRVLFSYPKLFAKFPVLARSDFRLSWRTLPTVISTRRYSIVKEHLICGGSYQICGIHYGGSIQITNDGFIPSSSSRRERQKDTPFQQNSQFIFVLQSANIPLIGSQRNEAKRASSFEILRKIFIIPLTYTREFRVGVTT